MPLQGSQNYYMHRRVCALSDRFTAAAVPSWHFIISSSGSGGRIGAIANHGCARTRKMVRQKRGETEREEV